MEKRNLLITSLIGITLFFLVISVLYTIIYTADKYPKAFQEVLQAFIPLVIFTGFFIFLVGAMILAISIFKFLES